MKFAFAFAAALFAFTGTAAAQSASFGVKGGYNAATVHLSDDSEGLDPKNRSGWVAGVFVVVPVSGIVAFQPEVLFSQQGTKVTSEGEDADLKLTYVQVPVLARIRLGANSPVGVVVGPSFGFLNSAKAGVAGVDVDVKDEFEKTDVGLVTGVTADAGRLVLDGRYTWGLRGIEKNNDGSGTVKNRVLSLTVGLRF